MHAEKKRRHNRRMTRPNLQLAAALGHEMTDKRLDILRRIGLAGSISEAARGAGVSYKAAWQAIDTLSNLAGTALLERTVGGAGGGGAQLTPAGERLIEAAEALGKARTQVLAGLAVEHPPGSMQAQGAAALNLRTSMRNQLPCTVRALKTSGQAVRVEMELPDGSPLYARITRVSAELLALAPGLKVWALCKATAVQISRNGPSGSAPNTLRGRATRVARASTGAEVALALDCGLQLVGFARPGHGIRARVVCQAHLEDSAVVIALTE